MPGALLLGAFFTLFYCLSYRITRNRLSAVLSIPLTVFSGGIGAYAWYQSGFNSNDYFQ